MTQTLTLADVKREALAYHTYGRLTAQHPDPDMRRCICRTGDGYRCAIGAALTDKTLNNSGFGEWNPAGISTLIAQQIIAVDKSELGEMVDIQVSHDAWAEARECDRAEFEEEFLDELRA